MLLSVSPGATTCEPEGATSRRAAERTGAVTAGADEAVRAGGGIAAAVAGR